MIRPTSVQQQSVLVQSLHSSKLGWRFLAGSSRSAFLQFHRNLDFFIFLFFFPLCLICSSPLERLNLDCQEPVQRVRRFPRLVKMSSW